MRVVKRVLWALAVVLTAIQFVPVDRSNPPVESKAVTSILVEEILERSCYDCHSNETKWPWYSYLAPMSWLVAGDVADARAHLNFSTWNKYSAAERQGIWSEIWEEVADDRMPLWFYLPLHPAAKLSDDDHETLRDWAERYGQGY